jgi:signal transduction histidine kinase
MRERVSEHVKKLRHRLESAKGPKRIVLLSALARAIGESDPRESAFLAEQAYFQGTQDGTPLPGCDRAVGMALLTLSITHARSAEYTKAFEEVEEARGIFERIGFEIGLAHADRAHGNVHLFRGEFREAKAPLKASLEVFRRRGDLASQSKALLSLAGANQFLGEVDDSERQYLEALRLERAAPDPEVRGKALFLLCQLRRGQGREPEAVESLLECLDIFEETGDREGLAATYALLGRVYKDLYRFSSARECIEKTLAIAREVDRPSTEVQALTHLADLDIAMDDPESAHERVREGLRIASEIDGRQARSLALRHLGATLTELGKLGEARAALEAAIEIYRSDRQVIGEAGCHESLGQVHSDRGDYEQAIASMECAIELYRSVNDSREVGKVLLRLGRVHRANGALPAAVKSLTEGLAIAEEGGERSHASEMHHELAECRGELGEYEAAFDHMVKFHDLECELRTREHEDRYQKLASLQELERHRQEALSQKELADRLRGLNTELEDANRNLRDANDAKNEMIGLVAHDLRTPLTAVIGFASVGERTGSDSPEELFSKIRHAAERSADIITSLVQAQKLEEGDLSLESTAVDFEALAAAAVEEQRPRAEEKGISVSIERLRFARIGEGDPKACRIVLDNLLGNALKFSPPGARVEVRVGSDTEFTSARLEVADEGPGIPMDEQGRLFTKFGRLSPRPTGDEVSTGLGLYSVRLLAEAMGGEVSCASRPGKGSTFRFEVPAA